METLPRAFFLVQGAEEVGGKAIRIGSGFTKWDKNKVLVQRVTAASWSRVNKLI